MARADEPVTGRSDGVMDAAPGDDVDRILADWMRERPDLDVSPLAVLSRLKRLARHLDAARRQAFATAQLEPWEFDVLSALRRSGPPYSLTPGQMIKATMVTSGTMTTRVDKLVGRGFVERRPDPADRRGRLISLTEAGRAAIDRAMTELVDIEQEFLEPLDHDDRASAARLLRALLLAAEGH